MEKARIFMKYTDISGGDIDSYIKSNEYLFQKKFDGVGCLVIIDKNGKINMESRTGKLHYEKRFSTIYFSFKNLIKAKVLPFNTILNGELIAKSEQLSDVQTLIQRKEEIDEAQKAAEPRIILFECAKWNGEDLTGENLLIRNKKLDLLRGKNPLIKIIESVNGEKNKTKLLKKLKDNGSEGIMIKGVNAKFNVGGRSSEIIKYKFFKEADCIWFGEVEMSKSKTNIGLPQNIELYQLDKDGNKISVGAVGGGFTFEQRTKLMQLKEQAKVKPIVVVVSYLCRGSNGRLRHPNFLRYHDTKDWGECVNYEM